MTMRVSSGRALRRLMLAGLVAFAGLAGGPALARHAGSNAGNNYTVDHDGVYLTQQIGRCLNGTGPCYYGGQCPGGEYITNAYTNGRVYCRDFREVPSYPPTFFESLFTGRW
jgi:hypothetical protein